MNPIIPHHWFATLSVKPFRWRACRTGEKALRKTAVFKPDVLILDLAAPQYKRYEGYRVPLDSSQPGVIVLSEQNDIAVKVRALEQVS